jgi:organic radical activating enzyme
MEVTLEITDICPNNCEYCSTNAKLAGYLRLTQAEVNLFLNDITKNNEIDRINISGGEPLSHPQFYDIYCLCKSYTNNVWVYTNALNQIMYNTDVIKEIKVEANVCLVPGKEVYIPKNADKVHLLQLVPQGRAKDMKPANIKVSSNLLPKEQDAHDCAHCGHVLFQANRKVVESPCKKCYE